MKGERSMNPPVARYEFLGMPVLVASPAMHELFRRVQQIAALPVTVLVTGETGAGKEIVARALHCFSPRNNQPWVDISCAALPEHLVESELFGRQRGAYSSADSAKPGLFELAHRGTLFLDEIGELPLAAQAKLLRVLDGAGFYRLGGVRKIQVDVRLIAATNRDLGELAQQGRFRQDLYHRLVQVQLRVPPLRERPEDIVPLAEHFLSQIAPQKRLSPEAQRLLLGYSWPGNVRELRNVVTAAAVACPADTIGPEYFPLATRGPVSQSLVRLAQQIEEAERPEELNLGALERRAITRALQLTGGHHQRAAELLGISRRTLARRLRQFAEGKFLAE